MTTYVDIHATVTRDGRWWMVDVADLDAVTQARRLADVEAAARDLAAVTLSVPAEHVRVTVELSSVAGVDVRREVAAIQRDRARAAELEHAASARATTLARTLVAHEIPLRDVGEILGVSHQRVHQLVIDPA